MTALEQQLMNELEESEERELKILEKLEEQESSFITLLQQQQTAYENSITTIVNNYEKNLLKIANDYELYVVKNTEEMKSLQEKHEKTVSDILVQINQILDTNITFGETGESYYEQLQTLKTQVWGLQEGQRELRTSLNNITEKMFPSQV